jgi:glycosyltransferase involved in cell wall biosynthesis
VHILLIEPYYGGSHRAWADGYKRYSRHEVRLLTLPAQFWKWRMQGGAVTFARLLTEGGLLPDVVLVSDMMNVATFRALTQDTLRDIPIALYFHETQLTYPQNSRQQHGWRYGFINYISALAADAVFFNSQYHLDVFFKTLPNMLKHFGDYDELQTIDSLRGKSSVLPLGIDLKRFDAYQAVSSTSTLPPLIVWNHRWEEEKNPSAFFSALYSLMERSIPFRVAITGENFQQHPAAFEEARARLGEHLIQYGYLPDFASYARLLWEADYVVSTSYQDFFGGSIAEAIYCGCVPILPHRLNYPYLVPRSLHSACLYQGNSPLGLLIAHLKAGQTVDMATLKGHIDQYDWSRIVKVYDDTLGNIRIYDRHRYGICSR